MSSEWQRFGYTGAQGTCLWCGRKLHYRKVMDMQLEAQLRADGLPSRDAFRWSMVRPARSGHYQDDSFCGLRCGYQFGLRQAQLGQRLERSS